MGIPTGPLPETIKQPIYQLRTSIEPLHSPITEQLTLDQGDLRGHPRRRMVSPEDPPKDPPRDPPGPPKGCLTATENGKPKCSMGFAHGSAGKKTVQGERASLTALRLTLVGARQWM